MVGGPRRAPRPQQLLAVCGIAAAIWIFAAAYSFVVPDTGLTDALRSFERQSHVKRDLDALAVVAFTRAVDPMSFREARATIIPSWQHSRKAAPAAPGARGDVRFRVDLLLFVDPKLRGTGMLDYPGCSVLNPEWSDTLEGTRQPLLTRVNKSNDRGVRAMADVAHSISSEAWGTRGVCAFIPWFGLYEATKRCPFYSRMQYLASVEVAQVIQRYGYIMVTDPYSMLTPSLYTLWPARDLVVGNAVGGENPITSTIGFNNGMAQSFHTDSGYARFKHMLGIYGSWVGRTNTVFDAARAIASLPPMDPQKMSNMVFEWAEAYSRSKLLLRAVTTVVDASRIGYSRALDMLCDSDTRGAGFVHLRCGKFPSNDKRDPTLIATRRTIRERHSVTIDFTAPVQVQTPAGYARYITTYWTPPVDLAIDTWKGVPPSAVPPLAEFKAKLSQFSAVPKHRPPSTIGDAAELPGPGSAVVFTYVSGHANTALEASTMLHPSWLFIRNISTRTWPYLTSLHKHHRASKWSRLDLILVAEPDVDPPMGCTVVGRPRPASNRSARVGRLQAPKPTSEHILEALKGKGATTTIHMNNDALPGRCVFVSMPLETENSLWSQLQMNDMHGVEALAHETLEPALKRYDYIIRVEPHTYLTPSLRSTRPSWRFVVPHAIHTPWQLGRLHHIAKKLGIEPFRLTELVGRWWMAESDLAIGMARMARVTAEWILRYEFQPGELVTWPDWWPASTAGYAQEIALWRVLNDFGQLKRVTERALLTSVEVSESIDLAPLLRAIDIDTNEKAFHRSKYLRGDYEGDVPPITDLLFSVNPADYARMISLIYRRELPSTCTPRPIVGSKSDCKSRGPRW